MMAEFKPIEQIIRIESNRKSDGWNVSLVKELVRCKDCRWRHDDSNPMWLPCNEVMKADDWFCADAERKDANG